MISIESSQDGEISLTCHICDIYHLAFVSKFCGCFAIFISFIYTDGLFFINSSTEMLAKEILDMFMLEIQIKVFNSY